MIASNPSPALVESTFANSPFLGLRKLRSRWERGTVVLEGRVDSYFEKQMAQEAIRDLPGVEQIDNRLTVPVTGRSRPEVGVRGSWQVNDRSPAQT